MKKIIISLFMVGLVSFGAYKVTKAYFSDTETSNNNSFAAGTLDLTLDGQNNTNIVKFTVNDVIPNMAGGDSWTVKNVGSTNGYLDIENISVVNTEGTNPESETNIVEPGDLGANMNITLFVDEGKDGAYNNGIDTMIYQGSMNGLLSNNLNYALNAGVEKNVQLLWEVPYTTGNDIQGDVVSMGMTFELGQTTAQ